MNHTTALENHPTPDPGADSDDKHTPFRCVQAGRIPQILAEIDNLSAAVLTVANSQARMEAKLDHLLTAKHDEEVAERTLSEIEQQEEKRAQKESLARREKQERRKEIGDWVRWSVPYIFAAVVIVLHDVLMRHP